MIQKLIVPDMIHNVIPHFFKTHSDFGTKSLVSIFLTFVLKFDVSIQNILGEINENVNWILENVVTTLNKTKIT